MKFITREDGRFVSQTIEQAPPRRIKLARMVKRLPTLKVPIGRTAYLGHKGEEEMTEHFFEDLYEEAPYLKDAPQDEVLTLYKAGLLNVFEDTDGEW